MRPKNLFALLLLALPGCGGGSSDRASAPRSADRFIGQWAGAYGIAGQPTEGTMAVTIRRRRATDEGVEIAGTATDVERGETAVSGFIPDSATGLATATFTLEFEPNNARWLFGEASIDARGHLFVRHIVSNAGIDHPTQDVDLAPVTPP